MKFYRIIFSVVFVIVASLSWGQSDTTYYSNGGIRTINKKAKIADKSIITITTFHEDGSIKSLQGFEHISDNMEYYGVNIFYRPSQFEKFSIDDLEAIHQKKKKKESSKEVSSIGKEETDDMPMPDTQKNWREHRRKNVENPIQEIKVYSTANLKLESTKKYDEWGELQMTETYSYSGDTTFSNAIDYINIMDKERSKTELITKTYPIKSSSLVDSIPYQYYKPISPYQYWSLKNDNEPELIDSDEWIKLLADKKTIITEEFSKVWYNDKHKYRDSIDYATSKKVFLNNSILFHSEDKNYLNNHLSNKKVINRNTISRFYYNSNHKLKKKQENNISTNYNDAGQIIRTYDSYSKEEILYSNNLIKNRKVNVDFLVYQEDYDLKGTKISDSYSVKLGDKLLNLDSLNYYKTTIADQDYRYLNKNQNHIFCTNNDTLIINQKKDIVIKTYLLKTWNNSLLISDTIWINKYEIKTHKVMPDIQHLGRTKDRITQEIKIKDIRDVGNFWWSCEVWVLSETGQLMTNSLFTNAKLKTFKEYKNGKLVKENDQELQSIRFYDSDGKLYRLENKYEQLEYRQGELYLQSSIDTINKSILMRTKRNGGEFKFTQYFDNKKGKVEFLNTEHYYIRINDDHGTIIDSLFEKTIDRQYSTNKDSLPEHHTFSRSEYWILKRTIEKKNDKEYLCKIYSDNGVVIASGNFEYSEDFLNSKKYKDDFTHEITNRKTNTWQYYNENGTIKYEIPPKGSSSNPISLFHENGKVKAKGNLSNTAPSHESKFSFENSSQSIINQRFIDTINSIIALPAEFRYPNGNWEFFYKNGVLAAKGKYTDGIKIGVWNFYHDNSSPMLKYDFSSQNVKEIEIFYSNKQLAIKGKTIKNNKTGSWQYYYENGNIEAKEFYENNHDTILWEYYYVSGNIRQKFTSVNNMIVGNYTKYAENGLIESNVVCNEKNTHYQYVIMSELTCHISKQDYYNEKGNIIKTSYYNTNGEEKTEQYYLNGKLKSVRGKWDELYAYYDSIGNLNYQYNLETDVTHKYVNGVTVMEIKPTNNDQYSYQSYYHSGEKKTNGQLTNSGSHHYSRNHKPIGVFVTKSLKNKTIRVTDYENGEDKFILNDKTYCLVILNKPSNDPKTMICYKRKTTDSLFITEPLDNSYRGNNYIINGFWTKENKKGKMIETGELISPTSFSQEIKIFEYRNGSLIEEGTDSLTIREKYQPNYIAIKNGTWKYYNNKGNLTKTELWDEGVLVKEE